MYFFYSLNFKCLTIIFLNQENKYCVNLENFWNVEILYIFFSRHLGHFKKLKIKNLQFRKKQKSENLDLKVQIYFATNIISFESFLRQYQNDSIVGHRFEGIEKTSFHRQCRQLDFHGR